MTRLSLQNKKRSFDRHILAINGFKSLFLVITLSFFGSFFNGCSNPERIKNEDIFAKIPVPSQSPLVEIDPNADFSVYQHSNPDHLRLPCSLCHIRNDNSAVPKFTGHMPCAGCHIEQFADNKNMICTICHTDPEKGGLKNFPTLKSFNAVFDHSRHLRQTNCATCHKPKNNISYTIPGRTTAHQNCFQCHKPETTIAGKNIGSCQTCHNPGKPPGPVTASANTLALSLTHGKHSFACTACHNVRAGGPRGKQISAPIVAMHLAPKNVSSCATCHNNRRAFGGDDFSDCKRCHQGDNFNFP